MAVDETTMATNTTAAIAAPMTIFIEPVEVVAALVFVGVIKREMRGVAAICVLEITGCEHCTVSACRRRHSLQLEEH